MDNTNNVIFNRKYLCKNGEFKITYKGKLFQNNSETVFIKYGYGDSWEHMKEQEMYSGYKGFCAKIIPEHEGDFNFCFRNSLNEWDNNDCKNYSTFIGKEVELPKAINIDALIDEILSSTEPEVENNTTPNTEDESNLQFEAINSENVATVSTENEQQSDVPNEEVACAVTENAQDTYNASEVIKDEKNDDFYVEDVLIPYYLANNSDEVQHLDTSEQADFASNINNIIQNENKEENVSTEFSASEAVKTSEEKKEDYSFVTDSFIPDDLKVEEKPVVNTVSTNSNSLVEYKISSPRKLSKFYFIKKKIKLAFYKLLVVIPKIFNGNLGKNQDE